LGRASTTEPSISMTPSLLAIASYLVYRGTTGHALE
jgi:hypothetical protein